jgi:hypothetical protein
LNIASLHYIKGTYNYLLGGYKFWPENRLIASVKGRRLPREEATAAIVSKLQNALPQLLPRAPGAQ